MAKTSEKGKQVDRRISGQSNQEMSAPAHALTPEQVIAELHTDPLNGLSPEEAELRLDVFGNNELGEVEGVQPVKIIIAQIANAMTLVK
jgi:magnesium-transporting ATPase (P-type)